MIDSTLKFAEYLHFMRSKCLKVMNLIFEILRLKLCKIYVLPNIFYGLPNTWFCINSIEKIQKYFTRILYQRCFPNKEIPSYIDRIKSINIPLLKSECLEIDLRHTF